jgi:indole-3-glycerol phosphate synthase
VSNGSYLDAIIPDVRRRLAERKTRVSQAEVEKMSAPGPRRPFVESLSVPGVSVIAEVKRFSPSRGAIRPQLDVGPVVAAYEAGGAAAVSVLTEGDHFGGSLADLQEAAAHTALPLLRKDFIVDPYQVYEARAYGASAVLLIAAALDDRTMHSLSALAGDLGLDVLLEVHDEREMARALEVGGVAIGINNRDLHTFEVSLETSLRLARLVPAGRLLVSESGVRDRADVEELASAGIDAVLVGESLLKEGGTALSALVHPILAVSPRSGEKAHIEEAR